MELQNLHVKTRVSLVEDGGSSQVVSGWWVVRDEFQIESIYGLF